MPSGMSSSPGTGRELGKTDVPTSGVMVMGTVFGMVRGRSVYVDGACKRVSSVCVTEGNHTKHLGRDVDGAFLRQGVGTVALCHENSLALPPCRVTLAPPLTFPIGK